MPGGCQQKITQKIAEKVVEKSLEGENGGVKVYIDAGSGKVKVAGDIKGFVYPGAKVEATYEAENGKAVSMTTNDPPEKVAKYYVKKFGKPTLKALQGKGLFLVWNNGLSVMSGREGNLTRVVVTLGR
jgi:hypothetical protein